MSADAYDPFKEEPTEAEVRWLHGDRPEAEPVPDIPFAEPDSWTPRNLALVDDSDPEPPHLGGLGLLYPSKRHVFSGPPEAAKTLAAYIACLSVVREGGRVLLIDFEMGERDAKRRLVELGASDEELGLVDYVEPEEPLTDDISTRLLAREPRLVVVDASAGAYDLQGLDDNKRGDVERFANTFMRPFWRAKVATLVIDHVVKNIEARGSYAIGSERKLGGSDVHLGFTTVNAITRGGDGHYKISTHKDRPGFHKRGLLKHMHLRSDPATHHIDWAFQDPEDGDETERRYTGYMEKVSRWLEHQSEQVTMTELKAGVDGKQEFIVAAVKTLVAEEYVEQVEGKRGALLTRILKPYREDDDPNVFDPFPTHSQNREQVADLTRSPFPPYRERDGTESEGPGMGHPFPKLDDDGIPF